MKYLKIVHTIAAIGLALFFIYAGVRKFIPKPPQAMDAAAIEKAEKKKADLIYAIQNNAYTSPATFSLTIKSMSASGFLKIVGVLQILSGLLMLYPVTRLIGALTLLPVILNIFLLHVFMDNRMDENIETGLLASLDILIIAYYKIRLKDLLILEPGIAESIV